MSTAGRTAISPITLADLARHAGLGQSTVSRVLRGRQPFSFGLALQYQQPWGLLIVSIGLLIQLPRMHFEEQVLRDTFPSYQGYQMHTARLIPRVY